MTPEDRAKLRAQCKAALPLDCEHEPGCELCPQHYPSSMDYREATPAHIVLTLLDDHDYFTGVYAASLADLQVANSQMREELESTLGRAKNAESIMCAASDERDAIKLEWRSSQQFSKNTNSENTKLKEAARALLDSYTPGDVFAKAKALEELL